MTATILLPWAFGIICSKTGFTCSRFCASPGVPPIAIAVNASFTKTVRITVRLSILISCLLFGRETHASTTRSDVLLLPTRNGPWREDGALRLGSSEQGYDAQDEGSAAVHSVTLPSGGGHQM